MTFDIAAAKRRRMIMLVINVLALVAAMAGAYGYFKLHIEGLQYLIAVGLAAGFGAQIWFIARLHRASKGA